MLIDKIYVISLKENFLRTSEKIERYRKQYSDFFAVPIEIFEAFDGRSNSILQDSGFQHYPGWKIQSDNYWWKRDLTGGEIGCSVSHFLVWTSIKESNFGVCLVLEEDFLIKDLDFLELLDCEFDWDLFYLGRIPLEADSCVLSDDLVNPGYSYQSHAYIIKNSAVNTFIESGFKMNIIPIDEFLSASFTSHPRRDIRDLFNIKIKAISTSNSFIVQDPSHNSSTESSGFSSSSSYKPLHPELFSFSHDSDFWASKYLDEQIVCKEFDLICDEPIDNVYLFPVFNSIFCEQLIEEAENFGLWTTDRHSQYPTTDLLLSHFGFENIFSCVLKKYVFPLLMHVYKLENYWLNAKIENFIAKYSVDHQKFLGIHHDGSYLSLILTLNTDFDGGGTYFPKYKKLVKPDRKGFMSVHPGIVGYLHGARPIYSGTRYIIASFIYDAKEE